MLSINFKGEINVKKSAKNKKVKNKTKTPIKFSNLIVILSVVHIDLFIIALFFLYYTGYSFSDTAITCFFTFWAIEMLSLAGIRIGKAKYNQLYEDNLNEINDKEV